MARVDDYINAKKLAAEELAKESLDEIAKRSGYDKTGTDQLRVSFLDRIYILSWPGFEFKDEAFENKEVPIQEQVIILHYLMAKFPGNKTEQWISFREIPGASFYFSAFVKRAIDPLKNVFGKDIALFAKAAGCLNGNAIDAGDAGFEFKLFPFVSLQLVLWEGDEEFTPEANILFQDTIGDIFLPEDVAWLSGMLVYRLVALSR
ncbi:DUF3786 domain-containing protein [Desulfobacterium sp. N47]|uniref:DUF3786 domain-containing protein n=1 Tax=uncultured Desulfobacterium sp. TaxID=201089 RepID=E1YL44_9BACT|nr:hypothetical protein N47_E43390 [uncultured Desulfobacterium sp.]